MKRSEVVILGAGIAGLGAGLKAAEENRDSVIFEARGTAGGLLDNFVVNGFRFDNAVHLSFATEPEVRSIFDKTDYITHSADSWNFERDRWLKHPVQNNLFPLPAEEKVELIESFLERPDMVGNDYESWLYHQYGASLARRYPLKYTTKYWDTHASSLSTTWIGNRMRRASTSEILFGAFTSDTPNTYYTKEMRYPKSGGYISFIKPLIDGSRIEYNHRASKIDLDNKTVEFENGSKVTYSKLVSSLPLPVLVDITKNVPDKIKDNSKSLKATSIDLISVGFNKKLVDKLWFYIYDEDILASRAYSPSVKSSDNVPNGRSSLQFEIYTRGTESKYNVEELKQNVIYALAKMNIATSDDIEFLHHKHIKFGNVIFDLGMEKKRDEIRDYFQERAVLTIGRFGEWDYLWSNQSFMSGYNIKF